MSNLANELNKDVIAKQTMNIILLVDKSGSMRGHKMDEVNAAIKEIIQYLKSLQADNANVNFDLSLMTFGSQAEWVNEDPINVDDYDFIDIESKGTTNLHGAYRLLNEKLLKKSQGGMMPDFGGIAPIILLLTDGHPNNGPWRKELDILENKPWFRVALRYGIAIELQDQKAIDVLNAYTNQNGEVIKVLDANMLKQIIKIIVLTASKVQSTSSNTVTKTAVKKVDMVRQQIIENITDVDDWEW